MHAEIWLNNFHDYLHSSTGSSAIKTHTNIMMINYK